MLLEVKCYATLAKYQPKDEDFFLGPNPTLRDLVGFLGIPETELKISFVNGEHAGLEQELYEGDRIGLFPAVGGG
jgi:molybdopterin converting factor small subunit